MNNLIITLQVYSGLIFALIIGFILVVLLTAKLTNWVINRFSKKKAQKPVKNYPYNAPKYLHTPRIFHREPVYEFVPETPKDFEKKRRAKRHISRLQRRYNLMHT